MMKEINYNNQMVELLLDKLKSEQHLFEDDFQKNV